MLALAYLTLTESVSDSLGRDNRETVSGEFVVCRTHPLDFYTVFAYVD